MLCLTNHSTAFSDVKCLLLYRVSPSLLRFSSILSVKQEDAFKKISGLKKKKEDTWFRNLENLGQHLTRGTAVIYDVFQIGM